MRTVLLALLAGMPMAALAQTAPNDAPRGTIQLSASLTTGSEPVSSGLVWRVFDLVADSSGARAVIAQSSDPQPTFSLPNGAYMIHASYGFASAVKAETIVAGQPRSDRLVLNAGGLEVHGVLGDTDITPDKLSVAIFVPEAGNSEAKLVVTAKPGQITRLPEGLYHIKSTYLDTVGVGSLTPVTDTNSIVSADLRVQAGKVVDATVRHRAAILTLKLVNNPGGEALANTSFTILTPGGDIIRELIGAFPSLVLAEGDYLIIARHNGKTYQSEFKVESNHDRDVEVLASTKP